MTLNEYHASHLHEMALLHTWYGTKSQNDINSFPLGVGLALAYSRSTCTHTCTCSPCMPAQEAGAFSRIPYSRKHWQGINFDKLMNVKKILHYSIAGIFHWSLILFFCSHSL